MCDPGPELPTAGLRVFAVAGEASGDRLLAPVVARLVSGGAEVFGLGGPLSIAAGLVPVVSAAGLAAHGLVEAAGALPATLHAFGRLRAAGIGADVALLVDFPEVNERLAAALRGRVPVVRLAPPQAWAWRPWRAAALRHNAANLCLFAFESEWLRAKGVHADWVGHPLADAPTPPWPEATGVALLPGSRSATVARLLPLIAPAVSALPRAWPVRLARAPGLDEAWLGEHLGLARARVEIVETVTEALAEATVAVAGAGTATLHAALAGRPVLTLARLHPASAAVARRLVQTPAFGLPNLVGGMPRLPELVQDEVTPANIEQAVRALATAAEAWRAPLLRLRLGLQRPDWAGRVARAVTAAVR